MHPKVIAQIDFGAVYGAPAKSGASDEPAENRHDIGPPVIPAIAE
jgi:hypothetical protein